MGLVDQLKTAEDQANVLSLLEKTKGYTDASDRTKRKWARVANKKLKEIRLKSESESNTEEVPGELIKTKKKTAKRKAVSKKKVVRKSKK